MDWTTNALTFKDGKNAETLGNSRPLINMNPKKWVTAGKVLIVPPDSAARGTVPDSFVFQTEEETGRKNSGGFTGKREGEAAFTIDW